MPMRDDGSLYFYELHEGDDELFTDVLLSHDSEFDEEEFLGMVLEARGAVLDRFEEDTLSEAIAAELARHHGFLVVDDRQLRVAVSVSAEEGETAVVAVEEMRAQRPPDDDEGFRSLLVDLEPEDRRWGDA
ncbi:hypothetical protein BH20CHL5_BH20CHL5_04190 [soil metagenome]|nr:hypothetical protein [Chloroflexota bacterium]MBA3627137.1 hypothetical protein [Chloroflexota bacterium]MBA3796149.1 hypothetical protein [Chloroflexota bacterium]MBA3960208.1 hypothetical protein [Chloroflexota bacterium]